MDSDYAMNYHVIVFLLRQCNRYTLGTLGVNEMCGVLFRDY